MTETERKMLEWMQLLVWEFMAFVRRHGDEDDEEDGKLAITLAALGTRIGLAWGDPECDGIVDEFADDPEMLQILNATMRNKM